MCHCQDTGDIVFLRSMNPVMRHFPYTFEFLGGYFASIGRNVAKIQAEGLFLHDLKPVLRHLLQFFEHFGGYFV